MKKRIIQLSVLQTGKFLALFYALLAVIMLPIMLIMTIASPKSIGPMLLMILCYPVMGFIGGIIMAFFYNLAAKWIGGLEVIVESIDEV